MTIEINRRMRALSLVSCLLLGGVPMAAMADETAKAARPSEEAIAEYRQHVEFLADPKMQGRGPGLHGNAAAATYLEEHFKSLGLQPAFGSSYRQEFTAGRNASARSGRFGVYSGEFDAATPVEMFQYGKDYTVIGSSGSTEASGMVTIVGYSIEKGGPDGKYATYPAEGPETPLAGQVAMIFRFEPMNEEGKSAWAKPEEAWSNAAAIAGKIEAAVKRGAVGVIVVCPPGTKDDRCGKLDTPEATARWTKTLEVPAIMMTTEAAERLVKMCGTDGRTLMDYRKLADAGGGTWRLQKDWARINVDMDRSERKTWNIGAILPGQGSLQDEYVVVGAHYDHVGLGHTGGSRSNEYGVVHPGADDNASGTAGLMMLARQMVAARDPGGAMPMRSVLFLGFSAEEMGLIGSREFVKKSTIEASKIYAMLNMDMIGRMRENVLEVSGTGTAEGFDAWLEPKFSASGLTVKKSPGGRGPSDHASFYAAGVPVLHFFTGLHEQYHTPRDTADLINNEGGMRTVELVRDVATGLVMRQEKLAFTSTDRKKSADAAAQEKSDKQDKADPGAGPRMAGVKVRFGIAPANYAEGEAGVGVGEVFPGTCAAEAGIQAGDRLIRWNGKEIADVQNWMEYLSDHKPGDVVDVDVKRGKEELRVRVTLKARSQEAR